MRALALNALFAESSLALRLKGVLEAVSADATPPREDPLWPKVVQKLSEQWKPEVFDKGRDLMLAEQRPRAKRALIDSFVEFVARGRQQPSPRSSRLLCSPISSTCTASRNPSRRPAIQGAVRKLGGNDPADLLAGKSPEKLETYIEYQKELQAGVDTLLKNEPSED